MNAPRSTSTSRGQTGGHENSSQASTTAEGIGFHPPNLLFPVLTWMLQNSKSCEKEEMV